MESVYTIPLVLPSKLARTQIVVTVKRFDPRAKTTVTPSSLNSIYLNVHEIHVTYQHTGRWFLLSPLPAIIHDFSIAVTSVTSLHRLTTMTCCMRSRVLLYFFSNSVFQG